MLKPSGAISSLTERLFLRKGHSFSLNSPPNPRQMPSPLPCQRLVSDTSCVIVLQCLQKVHVLTYRLPLPVLNNFFFWSIGSSFFSITFKHSSHWYHLQVNLCHVFNLFYNSHSPPFPHHLYVLEDAMYRSLLIFKVF